MKTEVMFKIKTVDKQITLGEDEARQAWEFLNKFFGPKYNYPYWTVSNTATIPMNNTTFTTCENKEHGLCEILELK